MKGFTHCFWWLLWEQALSEVWSLLERRRINTTKDGLNTHPLILDRHIPIQSIMLLLTPNILPDLPQTVYMCMNYIQ